MVWNGNWALKHPDSMLKYKSRYRNKWRIKFRKVWIPYHKIETMCRRKHLPKPSLVTEKWNNKNIKVARESNGRFISWLKLD